MPSPPDAAASLRASIVVVGDEILGGFVQDTNSGWLAGRLRELGVPLDRVLTVPDALDTIGEALGTELARSRPRVVLTSGGIGSTPDDLTMDAVAAHLDRPVVVQPDIDARISRVLARVAERGGTVTAEHEAAMRRMARVPDGARLLDGARGVAPGVALDLDGGCGAAGGATIVVLPGVPSELERIVRESVEPQLLQGRGTPEHVGELTHPYPESVLTPLLERLVDAHPELHVGSYPGPRCTVRLLGPRAAVEAALARVHAVLAELDADPGAAALRESWARAAPGGPAGAPR